MTYTLHTGDCRDVMATLAAESVDAIVCDPPYGLSFMGKGWDHGVPGVDFWVEALRVLKPGGHLIAFGGTRTYHRLAVAIEDAGFEVRDCLMWLYGSGFPKSHDVSKAMDKQAGAERSEFYIKPIAYPDSDTWGIPNHNSKGNNIGFTTQGTGDRKDMDGHGNIIKSLPSTDLAKEWHGWGTALKPAYEPAILARKPLRGTVADNVAQWGVGGLNIDGTRVGDESTLRPNSNAAGVFVGKGNEGQVNGSSSGRWPANVILDEEAAAALDAQSGVTKATHRVGKRASNQGKTFGLYSGQHEALKDYSDSGGASRFFYTAKASRSEREAGLDGTCTVKYNVDRSIIGDLSFKDVSTVAVQLLQKVTSDLAALKWLIDESGENITARYPSDSSFTTSMETNKITALKICNLLTHLLTSDFTADANFETTDGTSHAKSAESLRAWLLNITNEKTELALGAVNVASTTLSQINEVEPLQRNNIHSTVKPIALMRYMIRLVAPRGAVVLDPFMGSGSTGCAAMFEGMQFIGIDITPEYVDIARRRIAWWSASSPLDNTATIKLHEEETDA